MKCPNANDEQCRYPACHCHDKPLDYPPEVRTEGERRAYAAGWWKGLETRRESVLRNLWKSYDPL